MLVRSDSALLRTPRHCSGTIEQNNPIMIYSKPQFCRQGSALPMAMLCAAILLGLGSSAFRILQTRYQVVHQAASWKEALLTAEGGVEMAMNEIRKELYSP